MNGQSFTPLGRRGGRKSFAPTGRRGGAGKGKNQKGMMSKLKQSLNKALAVKGNMRWNTNDKVCLYYQMTNRCKKGAKCKFSHELQCYFCGQRDHGVGICPQLKFD